MVKQKIKILITSFCYNSPKLILFVSNTAKAIPTKLFMVTYETTVYVSSILVVFFIHAKVGWYSFACTSISKYLKFEEQTINKRK